MSDSAGDNGLPLAGIRVADFGWILAAPHATAWLGALGADVIRIENPRHVDIARFLGGTDGKMGVNRGGGFHAINFSKRSISLDLSIEAVAEIARRLVAGSDIAVENFATGTMRRFGLDYETLRGVKPDLIMLSATPLGQTGPFAAAVGYGPHTQAFSGVCELTGYPGGHPCGLGGAWPDFEVGVLMVVAILTALHHRDHTGEGAIYRPVNRRSHDCGASRSHDGLLHERERSGSNRKPRSRNRTPRCLPLRGRRSLDCVRGRFGRGVRRLV